MSHNPLIKTLNIYLARSIKSVLAGMISFTFTFSAFANPVVDNVAAGQVSIQQTQTTTTVNQASQKAIINWQSFNIGNGEHTHFQQPAGGIALNRISPNQGASSIYGQLTATGQIILINPAGIYFGPSAFVNVGGLIATTHNITDANFLSGNFQFNNVDPYSGAVINEGTIIAAQHGLVALVAPSVVNNGMIQVNLGKVVLASGNAFTMNFDGNGLINFVVNEATTSRGHDHNGVELSDGVKNTGTLIVNGGTIMVSGKAAAGVLDHVINMEGLAQAHSVVEQNGEIILSADTDVANHNVIRVAGTLDASGKNTDEKGGKVQITSKYIFADSGTHIDVSGDVGGGEVYLGGNYLGQGPLPNATATVMAPDAVIQANAITYGDGGHVILWADYVTKAHGRIEVKGGAQGGDGGFIETSGKYFLETAGIRVDTTAPQGNIGTWLLDPADITITPYNPVSDGSFDGGDPNIFSPDASASSSIINTYTLQNNLNAANVIINTSNVSGGGNGDIFISDTGINWSAATSLTLNPQAGRSVIFNNFASGITNTNSGSGLFINGNVSFTGDVTKTLQAGTLQVTGDITNTTGTGTSTLELYNEDTTGNSFISGNISKTSGGTLNLIKNMNGLIELRGTDGHNGSTYIQWGTLAVIVDAAGNSALSSAGNTSVATNSGTLRLIAADAATLLNTNTITLSGGNGFDNLGALQLYGAVSLNNNINLSSSSSIGYDGNGSDTFARLLGVISGSGTLTILGGINSTSTGGIELAGNNTYVGGAVLEGRVLLSHANGLSGSNNVYLGQATGNGELWLSNNITVSNPVTVYSEGGVIGNMGDNNTLASNIDLGGALTIELANNDTLTINGNINGLNFLSISGDGSLILNGGIGASTPLASFTIGDNINTTINTASIQATQQTYGNGNLTLGSNLALEATSGTITLNGAVNGAYSLSLATTGDIVINNTIGDSTPLASLSFPSLSINSTTLNGGSITTSGDQTYSIANNANPITLGTNVVLTSLSGDISSLSNINGGFNTLTISLAGNDGLLSGVLSSLNSLTKSGTGNLTLSGSNTFSGSVVLNAGTLTVANDSALGGTGSFTYNDGTFAISGNRTIAKNFSLNANLTLNISNNLTLSGAITDGAGTYGLIKEGSGNLTLSGIFTNNFNGGVTLNGGTLTLGKNSALGNGGTFTYQSGTLAFISDRSITNNIVLENYLTINNTNNLTLSGVISDTGLDGFSIWKTGNGNLTLSGNNTFKDGVLFAAGTITIGSDNALGTGRLDVIGGNNKTIGIVGDRNIANDILLSDGGLIFNSSNNIILSGLISEDNASSLFKNGSGDLTLSGANTFSGGVALNNGTLTVDNNSALGTGTLTYQNGSLVIGSNGMTIANSILLANDFAISGSNDVTFSGIISETGGARSITKTGSNNLTLSGNNTFTGGVAFNGGTLTMEHNNALGSGTFTYQDGSFVIGKNGMTIANAIELQNDFAIDGNNNVTFNGVISETGGARSITKTGNSNLTLAGNNTFTGGVVFSGGILTVGHNNALGTGTLSLNGGTLRSNDDSRVISNTYTVDSGSSIDGAFNMELSGSGTINNTLDINDTDSTTIRLSGALAGTGAIHQLEGTFNLSGNNENYSGAITVDSDSVLNVLNDHALGTGTATISSGATLNIVNGTQLDLLTTLTLNGNGVGGLGALTNATGTAGIGSAVDIVLASNTRISGGGTLTLDSTISGNAVLTKTGGGTLILNGDNTFNGGLSLNNGTLSVGHANALGSGTFTFNGGTLTAASNGITVNNDYVLASNPTIGGSNNITLAGNSTLTGSHSLTINNTGSTTLSGVLDGSGSLTKLGSGLLVLANANTYTGTTTINAGTLQLSGSGQLSDATAVTVGASGTFDLNDVSDTIGSLAGSGAVLLGSGTLTMGDANDTTFSGVISESGDLVKQGAGFFTLAGSNTYTGTTTVNAGTLQLNGSGRLSDTTAVTVGASGTFDLNDISDTIASLAGSGAVLLGTGTLTTGDANDTTFSGVISEGGNLVKQGAGNFILSGNNTFAGGVTLNGGTLTASHNSALGSGVLTYQSGTLAAGSSGINLANSISLEANITLSGTNNFTLSGVISEDGTPRSLTKNDSSVLTLAGSNAYTGTTTINAGTLQLSGSGRLNDTAALVVGASGTFDLNGISDTIGSLTGSGAVLLGSGTLTTGDVNDTTFSGVISETGSLVKQGSGNFILSGNNTFDGGVTLNGGTLTASHNDALGTGTLTYQSGTLAAGAPGINLANNISLEADIALGGNNNFTLSGVISEDATSRSLTKNDSSLLTLAGSNTYTGATTINGGTLQLSGSGRLNDTAALIVSASGTFDLNDISDTIGSLAGSGAVLLGSGTLTTGDANDTTFSGVISETGSLIKQGSGNFILSGDNTFAGGVTLNSGTLTVGHNNALGTGTLTYNAGTFAADVNGLSIANAVDLNADIALAGSNDFTLSGVIDGTGGVNKSGTSNLTLAGSNTFDGDVTLNGGTLTASHDNALGAGTLTYQSGTLTAGSSGINLANNISLEGDIVFGGTNNFALSGSIGEAGGAHGVTKTGTSTLTLNATNTYTGNTNINAGTIFIGAEVDSFSYSTIINIAAGATLDLNNTTESLGSISGAGNINLGSGSVGINSNTDTTFSGIISGVGGRLVKAGSGILTLSGANDYTGATTINAGTLRLSAENTLASSASVTLANTAGATLDLNNTNNVINNLSGGGATGGNVQLGSAQLTLNQSSNLTYDGVISGTGSIIKNGNATLILSGNNTYAGTTAINAGTLQLSGSGRLNDATAVTVGASGAFDLNNVSDTIASLAGSGAVLLGSGTLTTGNANDTTFSGVISETGSLVKQGSGNFILSGNNTFDGGVTLSSGTLTVGHNSALGTGTLTFNSGLLQNSGTRSIGNAITLGGTAQITAATGTVFTLNGNINGNQALTLNGSGTFALGGAIGNANAISSLTVGTALALNGSAITTVGNQAYNGLVTANSNTAITTTNAGATAISFNAGVAGTSDIVVSGNAAGNNTLLVNSGGTQNWTINAVNGGALGGISSYSGAFTYADIHNLTGGSGNDNFTLNGGTLAGSIVGGAGTNTLTADNVSNTWNLNGTNAATSMTGVGGGFTAIQNLVGGTGDDHFIFANNASITGTISGGATLVNTGDNILDFSAYSTLVNAYMTSGSNEFIGNVKNSGNTVIANYSNIDRLVGNEFTNNILTLPTGKNLSVVTFNPGSTRNGFIGDPLYFDFFTILGSPVPPPPSPTPTPVAPPIDIAQIVQQPSTSGTNNVNAPLSPEPPWVNNNDSLTQNMTSLTQQISEVFDSDLENIKINPYCTNSMAN